jgi:hypothetical protein
MTLYFAVFGAEMTVILIQRGLEHHTSLTMEFDIDDAQYGLMSKWNDRNKITE